MLNINDFLKISGPPTDENSDWLEGAAGAVEYVVKNSNSSDIILYAGAGQTYIHSVLARLDKVTPPDISDLRYAHAPPHSAWAINHCSGGGKPDRVYLSDPLDGCESLAGGEQLVFRRRFVGVDKGPARTEVSQRLIHALDLYWLDEERAYCRLNEDGDVEPVIRVFSMSESPEEHDDVVVTIDAHQLHRYMAVTDTALVMKFDFTRYRPKSFPGWHSPECSEHREGDLFYHAGVQTGCSYANGFFIVRPRLTKLDLIERNRREWRDEGKQYATFKAKDWKNKRLAEISCAPTALASYFEKDSPLPFQITPAFFKPEVLQKYKADPEKYTLQSRSISSRAGWSLKTFDVNEAGQIHTYLRYLADLPYSEQLYWQSFNEWPKAPISERAYQTDFEGAFSTIPDPLIDLKREVQRLDQSKADWWLPRGETLAATVHYPLTSSSEEWANAILALDQLIVEGIASKALIARLTTAKHSFDKQWGSIRLLQECLVCTGLGENDAIAVVGPFKQIHHLRSKAKGHAAEKEKQALIKAAKTNHRTLAAHFRHLVTELHAAFKIVVDRL
ncbi:hypothetical protein [Methylocystis sp.]|uniref:hypothetical protein n=1 Tax=Methylocystis sp. TaxID=1911079 RepID=UPI003DA3E3F7